MASEQQCPGHKVCLECLLASSFAQARKPCAAVCENSYVHARDLLVEGTPDESSGDCSFCNDASDRHGVVTCRPLQFSNQDKKDAEEYFGLRTRWKKTNLTAFQNEAGLENKIRPVPVPKILHRLFLNGCLDMILEKVTTELQNLSNSTHFNCLRTTDYAPIIEALRELHSLLYTNDSGEKVETLNEEPKVLKATPQVAGNVSKSSDIILVSGRYFMIPQPNMLLVVSLLVVEQLLWTAELLGEQIGQMSEGMLRYYKTVLEKEILDATESGSDMVKEVFIDFLQLKSCHELGSGAFGSVVAVENGPLKLALKVADLNQLGANNRWSRIVEPELRAMCPHLRGFPLSIETEMSSLNLPLVLSSCVEKTAQEENLLILMLRYPGSLTKFLSERSKSYLAKTPSDEETLKYRLEAAYITCQIAANLEVCHILGLVHRDLYPRNVLLNEKELSAILCDFSISIDKGYVSATPLTEDPSSSKSTTSECSSSVGSSDTIPRSRDDLKKLAELHKQLLHGVRPVNSQELFRKIIEKYYRPMEAYGRQSDKFQRHNSALCRKKGVSTLFPVWSF